MKLHLPKSLLVAALVAMSAVSSFAAEYNVATHNGGAANFTSSTSNYQVYNDSLTLAGNDIMGIISNGTLGTSHGKQEYSVSWGKYSEKSNTGNVTVNVLVNGTLTLTENARVDLGGQYKSPTSKLGTTTYDEYTGVIADQIVVSDSASLTSYNATVDVMEVNGGTVNLHTSGNSKYGNTHFVVFDSQDSKQVSIRSELNINGGTTTIGRADGTYLQTSFGKLTYSGDVWVAGELISVSKAEIEASQISQTAGTLNVQGDSVSVGGLNISQTGVDKSVMSISNGAYHDLADYGDSVIAQHNLHADTVLNLGIIRAYNSQYSVIKNKLEENGVKVELSPSLEISHSGAGDINMSGVDFTAQIGSSSAISTITQSDYVDAQTGAVTATTGSINLNGQYLGATFDIAQSAENGSIKLNGSMAVNEVNQTAGTINVAAKASMTASSVNVGGTFNVAEGGVLNAGVITVTEGGTLINNGAITGSSAAMVGDELAALANEDMLIVIAGGSMENYGETDKDILVQDGGTLTLGENASVAGVEITGGNINVNGDVTVSGALTLTGGTVTFMEDAVITLADGVEVVIEGASIVVNLSDASLDSLKNGGTYTLFDTSADLEEINGTTMIFVGESGETVTHNVNYAGEGAVELAPVVPEPTTATLSLLALAGLAARRRRK